MPSPTTELRAHLLAAGLAGTVATPREKSLRRYRLFAARHPLALIGLEPERDWRVPELVALMAAVCGVPPDRTRVCGPERIDPGRTIAALDRFAARLELAARRRAPVLLGTGHPDRLLGFYAALAAALSAAGCPVLAPAEGKRIDMADRFGLRPYNLCYVQGVALLREAGTRPVPGGGGAHTHSPLPVRTALAAAAGPGGRLPELVIGDHGWVCAAGQLGIEAMGPADADDPAPFVGEAEGQVSVAVPVDDSARPDSYRPLAHYVLNRARLSW